MNNKSIVKISKFLSLVLRHKPETIGIKISEDGWVNVNELIKKFNDYTIFNNTKLIPINKSILDEVVDTNNKKRFAYSEDGLSIRASQGHSIDVDLKLTPQIPPEFLYHGTAVRFVDAIYKSGGLSKMKRQHVHLSQEESTAINVGSRHGKPLILKVKASEMLKDGYKFFLSDNGVWLVDEVPVKYIDGQWERLNNYDH